VRARERSFPRVNKTELAKWFDITPEHLNLLVRDGILQLAHNEHKKQMIGRFDAGANVLAYIKHLRQQKRDAVGESEYSQLRNQKMATEAKMAILKLREMEGELIDRKRVVFIMTNLLTALKNHIRAIPARVSRLVLGLTSFGQVHDVLQSDVDRALREVNDFDMDQLATGISLNGTNGQHDRARRTKNKARRASK
jgi:hypothetical protein